MEQAISSEKANIVKIHVVEKKNRNYTVGELNTLFNYQYDKRGYEIEKDENGTITKYHYDPLGRLKTAELPGDRIQDYQYDDLGNRSKLVEIDAHYIKETTYSYDKDNRLLFSETTAGDDLTEQRFEYDLEGNLQKSIETIKYNGNLMAEKEFDYQYNGFNQLALVINSEDMIYEYTYDWQGLRTKKAFGDEAINFINEGGNTILETDKDMQITARNIRGKKLIYREINITSLEPTYLGYIHNGHGDIIGLTDEMGSVIKRYDYDPFGREEVAPSEGFGNNITTQIWMDEVEAIDNPFRYCGEYFDEETGNIYLRARYYSPIIGRMLSEDPARDGTNWYAYCGGNPIVFVDPSGYIRESGYVNGVWYEDPDAAEFGAKSSIYQMLVTLGNLWCGTSDQDLRDWYHYAADNIRNGERYHRSKLPIMPLPTFEIDEEQGIYYSPKNPLQKKAGYHDLYDSAFDLACNMDTAKMIFKYGNEEFRIQFWKGNYLNMGVGGEMGLYKLNTTIKKLEFYDCVDEEDYLQMSFGLFQEGNTIPNFIRYDSSHWWLTGFQPYNYIDSSEIRMIGGITFDDANMVNAFTNSIPYEVKYVINGLRVDFDWR